MTTQNRDPVLNVVHKGIRRGIRVALEHQCLPSAVILIYSGIDTMAYVGMDAAAIDVRQADFVQWADRYVRFPCQEQVTGVELYAARCAMLHSHGVDAPLTRHGRCRKILYADSMQPEVKAHSEIRDSVLVSIQGLADAFFAGTDKFLIEVFSDKARGLVAERRLMSCVQCIPIEPVAAG